MPILPWSACSQSIFIVIITKNFRGGLGDNGSTNIGGSDMPDSARLRQTAAKNFAQGKIKKAFKICDLFRYPWRLAKEKAAERLARVALYRLFTLPCHSELEAYKDIAVPYRRL
jgi:hypothetical protein